MLGAISKSERYHSETVSISFRSKNTGCSEDGLLPHQHSISSFDSQSGKQCDFYFLSASWKDGKEGMRGNEADWLRWRWQWSSRQTRILEALHLVKHGLRTGGRRNGGPASSERVLQVNWLWHVILRGQLTLTLQHMLCEAKRP